MWRVLFLILIVSVSLVFAQEKQDADLSEKPKAELIEEFAAVPNGRVRLYLDIFFNTLQNNPSAEGYVLTYGARKDVGRREKLFRNHIAFRRADSSRLKFVRGKGVEFKTQLWIVPAGAEPPTL